MIVNSSNPDTPLDFIYLKCISKPNGLGINVRTVVIMMRRVIGTTYKNGAARQLLARVVEATLGMPIYHFRDAQLQCSF